MRATASILWARRILALQRMTRLRTPAFNDAANQQRAVELAHNLIQAGRHRRNAAASEVGTIGELIRG